MAILDEAVRVARADGAQLPDDEPKRAMDTLMTYAPALGTSMYFADRLAGRPLEIEALTGAIVRRRRAAQYRQRRSTARR